MGLTSREDSYVRTNTVRNKILRLGGKGHGMSLPGYKGRRRDDKGDYPNEKEREIQNFCSDKTLDPDSEG